MLLAVVDSVRVGRVESSVIGPSHFLCLYSKLKIRRWNMYRFGGRLGVSCGGITIIVDALTVLLFTF